MMMNASIRALLVANILPLVGALILRWSIYDLVMLYWLENGIMGVYAIAKIMCATEIGPVGKTRPYKVILFCAHYGTFWMFHGSLLAFFMFPDAESLPILSLLFIPALIGFAISHGMSLRVNFFGLNERAKVSALKQMFVPYGRIAPTSVLLLVIAIVAVYFEMSGATMLAGTAVMKTVVDVWAHVSERRIIAAMSPSY